MKSKYIHIGKCIWCGKSFPDVNFNTEPHIIPHSLGGTEIGYDVCDDCNHYFGTATKGVPSIDLSFKEIFNAFKTFGAQLNENTYQNFSSVFFEYWHKKQVIRIKRNFNPIAITKQFKRSLYEIFLQKYHYETKNGNHPMFNMVREYARYGLGSPRVYYVFNNIILVPDEKSLLKLPMSEDIIDDMLKTGVYSFWLLGHCFYLEVLPIAFNANGNKFLQKEAGKMLIPAVGNERIFEFSDVMQIDFLMQRFNSK